MNETKITDLVPQETIDKIKELDTEIRSLLATYTNTAKELAKGIDINIRVIGDIDKLEKLLVDNTKEAAAVTEKLNTAVAIQGQVIANTTNTIARQRMEQERVNKAQRDTYAEHERVKKLLDQYHDTYEAQLQSLVKLNRELEQNRKAQKENEKALSSGLISIEKFSTKQAELIASHRSLSQEKKTLTQLMTAEEKAAQNPETSYNHMSQQLELLKKAYKGLSAEMRDSDIGQDLEESIQNLDAHLKDVAADMGEFQRNVGNYAIAGKNGVVATESIVAAMNQQAITMQDVADQTRILEEGKRMLDTTDEHYVETLAAINNQIEENKARLTDVSDIMEKDASSAAEAEAQNKRLTEAMKHIDLSADGAQERIDELNARIEKNNGIIERATPSTEKFAKEQKELAEAAKKAEKEQEKLNKELERQEKTNTTLAGQMLSLIGINENFASSLTSIETEGNVMDGLNTKVKALGKTLLGLLANPWVLAFLGITGVVAGFKWWYDYNKGLIEASRLTRNFTGLTGDAADKITTDCQIMADKMGKGFSETISAANTLVQQFGLSWEEALQKIEDGIVAGADMNGNLIENIDKFSGAFHDAGIEADQFIAILAETRNGIFDEKALKSITDAGTRLRSMTKNTSASLDAIGVSSRKMQDDLAKGNITMLEAIQQVTDKMKDLPPNCQEVGDVMKNVFGRKSAMAGEEVIKSISDINDNLDIAKANMEELGRVNEEQMDAQKELQETLAAVFKMSGTSFEEMTTQAKTYIVQGITGIIRGCAGIANWFVKVYNEAVYVRLCVGALTAVFKTLWTISKSLFELLVKGFQEVGGILEGIMLIMSGEFEKGMNRITMSFAQGFKDLGSIALKAGKEIGHNLADELSDAVERRLENVSIELDADLKGVGASSQGQSPEYNPSEKEEDDKAKAKAAKEAEKQAREELKRLHELEESKIAVMADSHEKELMLIRQKFKKRLDEIKGNGETENALRIQLAEQCMREIEMCEERYIKELTEINLDNRLAVVKKGSEEELVLRLAQLEKKRAEEIKAAEKTGADVNLINAKFNRERADLESEYANSRAAEIMKLYGIEEIMRNKYYSDAVNALKKRYADELALAKDNSAKQEELKRSLENDLFAMQVEYTKKSGEASISMIEEILNLEELSAEDRLRWEQELTNAKIDFANQVADANLESVGRQIADDERLREKRQANLERWMSVASEAISGVSDLVNALFDGQITKIEEAQEANTEAGEKEQERIADLVDKEVITQEEGEARKRAAEAQTAKKNEELEKKKAQLKYKQAVFDKAVSVAQAGISTALAIGNAMLTKPFLPLGLAMAAVAGTMGALQIATILATPIPKYAKGTDCHRGGPAIVGDGGRHELILIDRNAYMTPDRPTLVDMPAGAVVIPDIADFDSPNSEAVAHHYPVSDKSMPVYNDIAVRRAISELAYLIKSQTRQQHRDACINKYEFFKSKI